MSEATFLVGDVFDRLAEIPDGLVDLVLTSPPFLALRSYLPDDHPDKAKEIGLEPTPAEFLDTLLRLTAEWERVLAPHGSIAVELGDTYSGSGGSDGDYSDGGMRDSQQAFSGSAAKRRRNGLADNDRPSRVGRRAQFDDPRQQGRSSQGSGGHGWPLDKSLSGIPHLYHLSLAYGRNLLTGEQSPAGEWRVRNVVAWCRPNPAVGALGDKFRPATSYITIACKARDRWFDLDAVRKDPADTHYTHSLKSTVREGAGRGDDGTQFYNNGNPAGAPPLDWWEVPTEPYQGSHYATWPRKLLGRPIESMCPSEVCTACGEPRRRLVDAERTTIGWSECGCEAPWRPGIVLDPFAGSGTTLAVATGLGRDAIGIDLDERNADLARERVGMFLTVIAPGEVAA